MKNVYFVKIEAFTEYPERPKSLHELLLTDVDPNTIYKVLKKSKDEFGVD